MNVKKAYKMIKSELEARRKALPSPYNRKKIELLCFLKNLLEKDLDLESEMVRNFTSTKARLKRINSNKL